MDEGTPLADRLRPYLKDLGGDRFTDRPPARPQSPQPDDPPAAEPGGGVPAVQPPPVEPLWIRRQPEVEPAPVVPDAPPPSALDIPPLEPSVHAPAATVAPPAEPVVAAPAPQAAPAEGSPAPTTPWAAAEPAAARSATGSSAAAFTEEQMLRPAPAPAARGWKRVLRAASLGTYSPRPSAAEIAVQELVARIRTPVAGCRRIAIISRKGGVGKTTTTLMLGHALAQHRGDRVVALDGNPDAGSLGYRVTRQTPATITDLLDSAAQAATYADMRRYTSQATSRLEVVASDDDPHISQAIGEEEYRELIALVERHYNLILLDTGTGILDSATQGILRMADQLVLVLAPSLDGSRAAGLTLDWLESHGYGGLASDAVAVVNQARSRSLVEVLRVEDHFRARCREVVRIPWDLRLEVGGEAGLDELQAPTRQAYLELAAAVADGFALPGSR